MLQDFFNLATPIAVTVGVAFVAYNNYRSNKTSKSGEVIQNYAVLERQLKERVDALEKRLIAQAESHAAQMNELHRSLGEKEATIINQNVKLAEYKLILMNRGNVVEDALVQIKDFMSTIHALLVENHGISTANSDELHEQTALLKDSKQVVLVGEMHAQPVDAPPKPPAA